MLVAAVLRPEEREDGELEVVRLPLEQRDDSVELPVRQAELAMERLFDDGAQVTHSSPWRGRASTAPRRLGTVSLASDACPVATWACCSCSRRSGAPRSSSSSSASTSSSPRSWSSAGPWSAAVILLPLLAVVAGSRRCAVHWRPLVVLGLINNVLPFWLLGVCRDADRLGADRRDPGGSADLHGAHRGKARSRAGRPGSAARRGRRSAFSASRCSSACKAARRSSAPWPCSGPHSATPCPSCIAGRTVRRCPRSRSRSASSRVRRC